MTKTIPAYLTTLIVFIAIDMIWLLWLARPTYVAEMGDILRKQPNLIAAVAFYLLYAAGLMFFAIQPALKSGSWIQGLMLGAAMGLVAYGTYDLTNLSVMNGFGLKIALIDMAWGTFLSAITSMLVVMLLTAL